MLGTAMSFPLCDETPWSPLWLPALRSTVGWRVQWSRTCGLPGARFIVLMHLPLGTLLREIHGNKDHANNRHRHAQQEQDTHIQTPRQCLIRFVADLMRPGSRWEQGEDCREFHDAPWRDC